MAERPSIKQPMPLTATPVAPGRMDPAAPALTAQLLGGMQADISPEAAPLWHFVLTHARKLALGVVAIVALIVGVAVWHWWMEGSSSHAKLELGRMAAIQDNAARLAALEAYAPHAPKSLYLAAHMEVALAAVQAEQWDKAAAAYALVAEREKSSPLGITARLNRTDILMRLGKAQDALAELETLLPLVPEALRPSLNVQIGELAEQAGQPKKAIAAYEAALAAMPPSAQDAAYYKARLAALR